MRWLERVAASVTALGVLTGAAWAQLGFGGGPPVFETTHDTIDGESWQIDGPTFWFDPDGGPWIKTLLPPSTGWQPGVTYQIHEWFTIVPDPTTGVSLPVEDWHEEFLPGADGQIWDIWTDAWEPTISFDPMMGGDPVPGLEWSISADGASIWFDFDPIIAPAGGVTLHIWKDFQYTGQPGSLEPLRLLQYPTPAPGALAVLGFGGLIALRRRR